MQSLIQNLRAAARGKKPFLIAIDGRAASGKTTFAASLGAQLGATVLHMDDFCLPPSLRAPGVAGHMDMQRLRAEVLEPSIKGLNFAYSAFDCASGVVGAPRQIKPANAIIVEGCYSCHPLLARFYDYKIFMTCSPAAQQRRILARGGAAMVGAAKWAAFQKTWIPAEEAYFTAHPPAYDKLIDTTDMW